MSANYGELALSAAEANFRQQYSEPLPAKRMDWPSPVFERWKIFINAWLDACKWSLAYQAGQTLPPLPVKNNSGENAPYSYDDSGV